MSQRIKQIFRGLIYALPVVLFFSYRPIIALGASESMNFELSLPLIWLVLFDIVGLILLVQEKKLKEIPRKWPWLLLPIFLSLSILWSANQVRAILTVGIVWLIYGAIFAMFELKSLFCTREFREKFIKVFLISSLVICGVCLLQCILDLAGLPRETTLMCAGCSYRAFGFPHPNGFAIEPQFMGNLLLAPMLVAGYLWLKRKDWKYLVLFGIFMATIFLTFSRGAIYAGVIAMAGLVAYEVIKAKTWKPLLLGLVTVIAFILTLNLQGIFAQVSKTDDTYATGVAKVINQLSLGVIDIRPAEVADEDLVVEDLGVEDLAETAEGDESQATFDGYVEESTNTRVRLSVQAAAVWTKDFWTLLFGVGIGGAGTSLYQNGFTASPKEIVQNQYMSLILETGIVGFSLFVFSVILAVRVVFRLKGRALILALMVAYAISLFFFSGLANALHIYLLTGALMAISYSIFVKKPSNNPSKRPLQKSKF